jgi:hypothetical protein
MEGGAHLVDLQSQRDRVRGCAEILYCLFDILAVEWPSQSTDAETAHRRAAFAGMQFML